MIRYPLAGEFAVSRDAIEGLNLSSAYSVEMYLLFQLLDLVGSSSMAQVDLQVYNHIGQKFLKLENLAHQVGTCIVGRVAEKRKKSLTDKESKQILRSYKENASQRIRKSEKWISRLRKSTELRAPKKLVYSREEDEKRLQCFLKVLENILSEKAKERIISLPSWDTIRAKTGNYFVLREILRRRSNQSTWSRLKECGLIKRPPTLEK
jgi:glucosyl-3-phosphoglycerate synthase